MFPEATLLADGNNIVLTLSEEAINKVRTDAVKQNINTLHNRVNELGVAEPVIQQSGLDRIVVQRRVYKILPKQKTLSVVPRLWKCAWWKTIRLNCKKP